MLGELSIFIDHRLSTWMSGLKGYPAREAEKLRHLVDSIETNGDLDDAKYAHAWGRYAGREEEYFVQCSRALKSTDKQELRDVLGQEFSTRWLHILDQFGRLRQNIAPELLLFDEGEFLRLSHNREDDALIMWFLRLFDGANRTEDVMKLAMSRQLRAGRILEQAMKKGILVETGQSVLRRESS